MVDSKHQWKAWIYLLPAIILLLIFTVWPIINTVATSFVYYNEFLPADIQVEAVEDGGYRFFYEVDKTTKSYMTAQTAEDGSVHLGYVGEVSNTDSVFTYDAEISAWTVTVGGATYFVGATDDSDMDLYAVTEENIQKLDMLDSLYPAALFATGTPGKLITEPVTLQGITDTDPEATTEGGSSNEKVTYQLGVFKGIPEAFRYVTAIGMDGFINATDDLDEAAQIRGEAVKVDDKKGFKLHMQDKIDGETVKTYMLATLTEEGTISLEYTTEDGTPFFYNTEKSAWTCTLGETVYYLGLDGTQIGVYPLDALTAAEEETTAEEGAPAAESIPEPAAIYMHRGTASEAKPMTTFMSGYAYRVGAHSAAEGFQTYLTTGASTVSGLMLTDDVIEGESFSGVGFDNFVNVLTDPGSDFMVCLKNTFILTVITVPISTVLALLIAVALNSIKPLQRLLQTIFFLPYVTNSIAIGMVFAAMFNIVGLGYPNESVGIINNILGVFGVERINWINTGAESWASFTALIIYIVWNALPFKILILLGGLQSINKQYYDAAKIDSTPKWRVLTRITVPLLSPMLTYTVITSFISGFKEYSSVVGIFGDAKAVAGGANMNTIVGHIQNHLTEGVPDYGRAGAAALMLFVIIFIVTMINLRISKKSTHY